MEKPSNKLKTHDFMNVESFSQLPFIRPTHEDHKERPIRLFGIEFECPQETHQESNFKLENNNNDEEEDDQSINKSCLETNSTNNRRFECHYCCRNFPTSQALGGHQNAHKRERQHAKRLHLLSTAAANTNANANAAAALGYGSRQHGFGIHTSTSSYPWTSSRVFGSHHHNHLVAGAYNSPVTTTSPTINGTRLGLWRSYGATSPTFNLDRSSDKNQSLRFLSARGDYELTPSCVVGGGSSTRGLLYESKTSVQDHVSLDLHL